MRVFGRKAKARAMRVGVLDAEGVCLFEDVVTRLAVPEDVVLGLSVEFFNDPAPCHIHRGAVLSRVFLEISQALEARSPMLVSELPGAMGAYLALYPGAYSIQRC